MKPDYAARYGSLERWHWWFRGRQRIFEDILRRELPDDRRRVVVTVGCGPIEGLRWLLPFAGHEGRVIGLDADASHAGNLIPGVLYVVGRLETTPLHDACADVVLALDVLEHIEDDVAALREAARMIRPGGVLIVSVPALPSLWGPQDEVNLHVRRYTRSRLADAFSRSGLPRPRLSYFNTFLFPVVAAVRWARRLTGRNDDNRPGLMNDFLLSVFQLERILLRRVTLPVGVSLLGILRFDDGVARDRACG